MLHSLCWPMYFLSPGIDYNVTVVTCTCMQCFLMVYHGVSYLPLVFFWCSHSPKGLCVHQENACQVTQDTCTKCSIMSNTKTTRYMYSRFILPTSFLGSLILPPPETSEERPWHIRVTCLPESGR